MNSSGNIPFLKKAQYWYDLQNYYSTFVFVMHTSSTKKLTPQNIFKFDLKNKN